jgi:hypothetical protein
MADPIAPVAPAVAAVVETPAAPAAQPAVAAPEAPKPEAPKPRAWAPKAKPAQPAAAASPAAPAQPDTSAKPKGVSGIGTRKIAALESKLAASEKDVAEAKALREELAHYAKRELEGAPENARKFVLSKHKDDPRAQLAALRELREAGLLEGPKASPVAQPAANTAPPKAPVADATDPDVQLAQQHRLLSGDPSKFIIANAFKSKHSAAIARGEQKLAAKN